MESRSPGKKTISAYLAKYLSKSFHLRSLYQEHGFQANSKAYHFFKNLYDYELKVALCQNGQKLDAQTGQHLPRNQHIFRHFNYQTSQTTYFYRTQEKLVGQCLKPTLLKKNYRLGTRSLNPLNLLSLFSKSSQKATLNFAKFKKSAPKSFLQKDFQEFLITRLLLLCKTAEFSQLPLEQKQVPKELALCNQSITSHFQTKSVLHFTFEPEQASLIRQFMANLDTYAQEYDLETDQDFYTYPQRHNQEHEALQQLGELCGCEEQARNQYLNNWALNYFYPSSDNWRRTPI